MKCVVENRSAIKAAAPGRRELLLRHLETTKAGHTSSRYALSAKNRLSLMQRS